MFKRKRFFYFSDKTLGYQEVRFFRTKAVFSVLVLAGVLFGALYLVNSLIGDPLGLAKKADLAVENSILKQQLSALTTKASFVQKNIDELLEQNNQLRVMVDLKTIDGETKQAAVGGALRTPEFSFLGRETGSLLKASHELLSKLEREVDLQKRSYEEITRQYAANKVMFQHLPAIKPSEGPYSINGFGMRIHPVLGMWRMHEGIDIIALDGTPVYAAGDAVVRYAGRTHGGYGAVVELTHGYGYTTLYAHLSKIQVKVGQKVKRGELIGRVGRSGLVSGPHLHYEVRLNGRRQNPVDYFFDDVDAARYRAQLAAVQ